MSLQGIEILAGSSRIASERAGRSCILTINGGSSSLKFGLFATDVRPSASCPVGSSGSACRFHLVGDVIDRLPKLGSNAVYAKQAARDKLIEHKQYISRYGEDMPEVRDWKWTVTTRT